ncbi:MAG: esterase/lipase family protein [Burkholderiales bacterium]
MFVHGIYGGEDTFVNTSVSPAFSWPRSIASTVSGKSVDVYRLEYRTELLAWSRRNVAELDEVDSTVLPLLTALRGRGYESVNFIAHSLGGNVVQAYLLSVKNSLGHVARAQHGFVITLGTPVSGAAIANVGLLLKDMLGMPDPLLSALAKDNTFLRMMRLWSSQTETKALMLRCRPVRLYAAIETLPVGLIQVVDVKSARSSLSQDATFKEFDLNHLQISRPSSVEDELFRWVEGILKREFERIEGWLGAPCRAL